MKADTVLAIFGAAFLLAACGAKDAEIETPPPPGVPKGQILGRVDLGFGDEAELIELQGVRCVVVDLYQAGGISCEWPKPDDYGADLERASCTTDTDCMEKFGGDGGPAPRRARF